MKRAAGSTPTTGIHCQIQELEQYALFLVLYRYIDIRDSSDRRGGRSKNMLMIGKPLSDSVAPCSTPALVLV